MPEIISESSLLLHKMFNENRCLFSYSSFMHDNDVVNDFSHPSVFRYSINALLGLQKATSYYQLDWDFNRLLDKFMERYSQHIRNYGDRGLLTYILSIAGHELRENFSRELIGYIKKRDLLIGLNLQELCWMLLGLLKDAEINGNTEGVDAAVRLFRFIHKNFFNKDTLMPFHSLKRWRKPFSSFGVIVYFLWALYEYARFFKDAYAEAIFKEASLRLIKFQGEQGEWPWFFNVNLAQVVDWYQIYSVHQDSMAMLFLFPALDLGLHQARKAIIKSYRWLFGENELNKPVISRDPFFIYRSIRRKQQPEIAIRYLRGILFSILKKDAMRAGTFDIEINKECRSYHLGWILFVWSGVNDFSEFIELKI